MGRKGKKKSDDQAQGGDESSAPKAPQSLPQLMQGMEIGQRRGDQGPQRNPGGRGGGGGDPQPGQGGRRGPQEQSARDDRRGPQEQRYIPGMPPPKSQSGPQEQRYIPGMPPPKSQSQDTTQPGSSSQAAGGAWGQPRSQPAGGAWGQPRPQQSPQAQGPSAASPARMQQQPSPQQAGSTTSVSQQSTPRRDDKNVTTSPSKVPLSVTSVDLKALPDSIKKQLQSQIPVRRDVTKAGKQGRPIRVRTNMMAIDFGKNFKVSATHYDIQFDPDRPKFLKRPAFNALRQLKFPKNWPAFDGRANVYSAGDLPFGDHLECEVEVKNEERDKIVPIKITLKKANTIDIGWLKDVRPGLKEHERDHTSMQVLDVVLRCAAYDKAVMVARSFYQRPSKPFDLGGGMELWTGLFQSAVLGWKPYLNVDVAHKGFPTSQPVIQAMMSLCGTFREPCTQLTPNEFDRNGKKIETYLKTLKVVYQLPNKPSTKRTFGINGLTQSPRNYRFKLDDGRETTVFEYFANVKDYRIRYPDIPCLWVGSKTKLPKIVLPPELCTIVSGLVTNRKLNEQQTTNMIRQAATAPKVREGKIMDAFKAMDFQNNPTMKEFGLTVTAQFAEVGARVLQAPNLRDKRDIRVARGIWNANEFYQSERIEQGKWTILNLSQYCRTDEIQRFVQCLQQNKNGMVIGEPIKPFGSIQLRRDDKRGLINFLEEKKNQGVKLVVVIIPGKLADVYPKVKQVAELKVGMLTQCIKDETVQRKMNPATAGNILLKLNSKLNGVNHIINPQSEPPCLKGAMFIGADVTHPSPDAVDIPSIAAVAASFDSTAFKYNVTIKLQPARQEIISDLTAIVHNQISIYMERNNGNKPTKLIYYRDGVSEGQFPQIMHFELPAIRQACTNIARAQGKGEKYEPKITFLVVQKRHHVRLFPSDPRNSDDRNGNVQAGTVVDTEITHPSHIDFYLVSHASIQGTARPTKYRCLWDDSDMSEDEIEQLTYYLCHMFSRCTRSVSYPAPTYYAHLAAFRARSLIYDVPIQMTNLENEQRNKLTLHENFHFNNPMFFV